MTLSGAQLKSLAECIVECIVEQLAPLLSKAELLAEIDRLRLRSRSGADKVITQGMLQRFIQRGLTWQSNGDSEESFL